jgi:ribosome maturation factor RimP
MTDKQTIIDLVNQFLSDTGSESYLVEVSVSHDNAITVEIDNDHGVNIDECVELSNFMNEHLDRNVEDYELEVGSACLSAPLKCLRQFAKYADQPVEVLTRSGEKLKGILGAADENGFDITVTRKVKPEGSKKKVEVTETLHLEHAAVNAVKYDLDNL